MSSEGVSAPLELSSGSHHCQGQLSIVGVQIHCGHSTGPLPEPSPPLLVALALAPPAPRSPKRPTRDLHRGTVGGGGRMVEARCMGRCMVRLDVTTVGICGLSQETGDLGLIGSVRHAVLSICPRQFWATQFTSQNFRKAANSTKTVERQRGNLPRIHYVLKLIKKALMCVASAPDSTRPMMIGDVFAISLAVPAISWANWPMAFFDHYV